jgi:hypothetical protein
MPDRRDGEDGGQDPLEPSFDLEKLSLGSAPPFDWREYRHLVPELPDEVAQPHLEAVWTIVTAFVDLAWGTDSVTLAMEARRRDEAAAAAKPASAGPARRKRTRRRRSAAGRVEDRAADPDTEQSTAPSSHGPPGRDQPCRSHKPTPVRDDPGPVAEPVQRSTKRQSRRRPDR